MENQNDSITSKKNVGIHELTKKPSDLGIAISPIHDENAKNAENVEDTLPAKDEQTKNEDENGDYEEERMIPKLDAHQPMTPGSNELSGEYFAGYFAGSCSNNDNQHQCYNTNYQPNQH